MERVRECKRENIYETERTKEVQTTCTYSKRSRPLPLWARSAGPMCLVNFQGREEVGAVNNNRARA